MADSTLAAIQIKVRRLTRSPSEQQLTTTELNQYINTFVLYDIPSQLRLFDLKHIFTFYTNPYQGLYQNSIVPGNPWYNFNNLYITCDQPAYCAGYPMFWSQSREQFFNIYPQTNSILSIGTTGDGVQTHYTGTLAAHPLTPGMVSFVSIDTTNNGLYLTDDGNGNLTGSGAGVIDYVTSVYDITFSLPPGLAQMIYSETVPYTPARPNSILFFDNKFILRPIPNIPYKITFEVFQRPTELLANNQSPDLEQWWQYIAYGAAKKVFEDRSDMDSIQQILPEFKQQERFILRRTLVDMAKERTATIYTEQIGTGAGGFGWNPTGGSF